MHQKELRPDVVIKKSPFLVVKQLGGGEVRVYSKLHGNLTSFDFDISQILNIFESPIDVGTAVNRVTEIRGGDSLALIRELYEKGFLVEEYGSEKEMLSEYVELVRDKTRIPKISKVTFLISAECNLACKGCYHTFCDFKSADMKGDFAGRVLDGLFPYLRKRGIPALVISFLGYEPLLNFETMRDIYDRARRMGEEYGIKTSLRIYTNAFAVSEEIFEWIDRHKDNLAIKVSLDGIREDNDKRRVDFSGRGTYDRVVANLKRMVATGVECGVLTVLSKLNIGNIEKFVDEMAAIGIRTISANIFCGQSSDERLMELTESEKFEAIKRMDLATEKYGIEFDGEWKLPVVQMIIGAQFFCPAGGKQLVFCADGAIYPCQRFAGTEMNFGTYKDDFWESLIDSQCESYNDWTSDLYNSVAERTKEDKMDLPGCSCPFLPFIRGECISKNLEKEFNEYLLEYYVTRSLNRILSKSSVICHN